MLSIAQILGVSLRNNQRDQITGCMMFYTGGCLQALEGKRVDLDRLMSRIREDRRHTRIRVLVDKPIAKRRYDEPMAICDDPQSAMRMIGTDDIAALTAYDVERIVEFKQAA